MKKKLPSVIAAIYIYVFFSAFVLPYFEFEPWINFLFHSAGAILRQLHYNVIIEPSYLIGDNGTIYMAKACLGFKTMLLFASVVYLTGDNNKTRWAYILSGFVFLNIVNIIRFVLLFIHIQKHGGYVLSIDLHDMYKYITYTLVFFMWIIWFEKYSDIKKKGKILPGDK